MLQLLATTSFKLEDYKYYLKCWGEGLWPKGLDNKNNF
jgi:hypothetical protein